MVDGINGMEPCAALFDMCDKSVGKDVSIKHGEVAQLVYPHVFNNGEDEVGGAADVCVVEGVILDTDLPDGPKFPGMVDGFQRYGGVGANVLGRGKSITILCCIGVHWGYDAPYVVFSVGLDVSRLYE